MKNWKNEVKLFKIGEKVDQGTQVEVKIQKL